MTENIHIKSNTQPNILAYASELVSIDNLESLKDYCALLNEESDIYAEDIHPESFVRPMFQTVLEKIQNKEIKTLIVPSLYHLAGSNEVLLRKILNLIKANHVELVILSNHKSKSAVFSLVQGGIQ